MTCPTEVLSNADFYVALAQYTLHFNCWELHFKSSIVII